MSTSQWVDQRMDRRKRVRARRGMSALAVFAIACALLFGGASTALAVASDVPGTPMGPSGASGVLDKETHPRDVYAVYLFAGRAVAFNANWNGNQQSSQRLYAPGILTVDNAYSLESTYGDYHHVLEYTPAVSGIYYLEVSTYGNGVRYSIAVSGAEALPQRTHTSLSVASKVKVKRRLRLSGTVSSAAPTTGTVTITKTRLVGRKWKKAGSAKVKVNAKTGRYSYSFKPNRKGKWRFVARYSACQIGSTVYASSKSRTRTTRVK